MAGRHRRLDSGVGGACRLEHLRGGKSAERVSGEVAPGAVIPMDVLEAAETIIRWLEAKEATACRRSKRPEGRPDQGRPQASPAPDRIGE